jgi:hypothetical protein
MTERINTKEIKRIWIFLKESQGFRKITEIILIFALKTTIVTLNISNEYNPKGLNTKNLDILKDMTVVLFICTMTSLFLKTSPPITA